ncbi:MAG: MFS transporter [Prolixibacteraceae bacterium]|nr:MFS transporter [Prolixibacteraceae bacterium]
MSFIEKYQKSIIKAVFFMAYASAAVWLSFFYVYLKDGAGLSGFEVGIIAGFQQFNNLFVLPVWGGLADRYGRKRMLLFSIGSTIVLLPVFIVLQGALSLTVFMIMVTLVYNPVASLVDTIALDYQEQSGGKTSYGEIRLWASVGWGLASFVAGMLIHKENLYLIFPVSSGMFLITWLLMFFLYQPLKVHRNLNNLKRGNFLSLLKNEKVLLAFFMLVLMYSIFSAPIYLILNVYFLDIGASNSMIGLAFLVQGLFEIPFFFFGKRLVDRYGAKQVFLFAMLATSLRMMGYGMTGNPAVAVAIGAIHGISIGLFFVSVVSFVHRIVPSHYRTSGQAFFYTFFAVGVAIGNMLTGMLMDHFSMRMTMIWNALGIMLLILLVLITQRFFRRSVA